jgi:hypothetical protein
MNIINYSHILIRVVKKNLKSYFPLYFNYIKNHIEDIYRSNHIMEDTIVLFLFLFLSRKGTKWIEKVLCDR